jgi:hypothetical protein
VEFFRPFFWLSKTSIRRNILFGQVCKIFLSRHYEYANIWKKVLH